MKIFKEVKCSERLPNKEGWYHCIDMLGRHGAYQFFNDKKLDYYWKPSIIDYWYEPIEIELDSEKILPKEERCLFKVCESAEDVQDYAEQLEKALEAAELKNIQLQEEVNKLQFKYNEVREMADEQINKLKEQYTICKEIADRRKEQIDLLTSDADERYNRALEILQKEDKLVTPKEFDNLIFKALKIGIYGK